MAVLGSSLVGCASLRLPGLDHRVDFSLIQGKTADEVRAAVGPPAFSTASRTPLSWVYPVRRVDSTGGCCVPAPRLEFEFGAEGTLRGWRFVHPATGRTMAVRDTPAEVERWRSRLCSPPRLLFLSEFTPGVTNASEVEPRMGSHESGMRWSRYLQKSRTADGEVWTFYVDRPSVAYIPAFEYEVLFRDGRAIGGGVHGYAGRPVPLLGCV